MSRLQLAVPNLTKRELILPIEQLCAEHLPQDVPCLDESKTLGIAPEIVTVAIRTYKAFSVPEIDVAGEMFRIKTWFISFITSFFGLTNIQFNLIKIFLSFL